MVVAPVVGTRPPSVTVTGPVVIPWTASLTYLTLSVTVRGANSSTGGAPSGSLSAAKDPTGLNSTPSRLPRTTTDPWKAPRQRRHVSASDPVGGRKVAVSTGGVWPLKPAASDATVPKPFSPGAETADTWQVTVVS